MIPKWRPVQVCCKGYARSSNGTSCVPICSQHCYHGQCVEPDVCKCEPGFGGQACSKCKFCICIQKRIENSVKLKFFLKNNAYILKNIILAGLTVSVCKCEKPRSRSL